MLNSLRPIAAAACHLLVLCCVATAQQGGASTAANPAQSPPTVTARPAPRIEESRPSIYYLPDKQGNLQPVLDFQYQDFADLYKLKNQLGPRDQPPPYSLQRMSAVGTAGETHAELTVEFQVVVRDDDWVRVPLQLDQTLLRGDVKYKGDGRQFVQYEKDAGYVCWIRGKADSRHEIALTLLAPLEVVGDETRLNLSAPRATASELKFTTPKAGLLGSVSEGATLLASAAAKDGATEFNVVGLGGDFQLAWRKAGPSASESPVVLEATCTAIARLDGRSISTEATLSVRSLGAAFDRLTVRLPPDAELVPGKSNGYTATPLASQNGQQSVEVRLPKKTAGPVEIRLGCRRNHDPVKNAAWCELAGFEVVGAARQWGTMAVAVDGDWQVLWGEGRESRQIDPLPETLRRETNVVAGFEYAAAPYSLPIKLSPRKTRIGVEPVYAMSVERDRIRLDGRLTYTIRGAKVSTLDIAIPGWTLDEVGPESLVAVDGLSTQSDTVSIPLVRPTSGTIELQLRAHRAIASKATSLVAPLPSPKDGAVGPASLTVTAADNVELTPNNRLIEGLVRQRTGAAPLPPAMPRQTPLYYRGGDGHAVFAADFRVHPRRITVDASSHATLAGRTATVEQTFRYEIAHEPVDQLTVAIPRSLAASGQISIWTGQGESLSPVVSADALAANARATPLARLTLPEPCIGPLELTLNYTVALTDSISIPLAMPADGELRTNRAIVNADKNFRVTPRKGSWTAAEGNLPKKIKGGSRRTLDTLLTNKEPAASLDLDVQPTQDPADESTLVDRAWIQSWLTSTTRQDRAVFSFVTDLDELEVVLPPDADAQRAAVLLDGRRVEPKLLGDGRLSIPLSDGESRRATLELRYQFLTPRPPRGAIGLEFPRLIPKAWMQRVYWQLILPANEHLTAAPEGFTGEFLWTWNGWYWGRNPVLDQSQLETWVGAAPRDGLPDRANLYLFSSLGNVEGAEVGTAGRTWIVLWASGAALVAGLLLIYVPPCRHPAALLIVGIALLAAGLIAPEPTLLAAQAAILGLALTLFAGLLERGAARRRRAAARKEPSSSRIEVGSTHTDFQMAAFGNPPSTQALPSAPSSGSAER